MNVRNDVEQIYLRRGSESAYSLCALDLWWLMWVVIVDLEGEVERAALVHAYSAVLNEDPTRFLHTYLRLV